MNDKRFVEYARFIDGETNVVEKIMYTDRKTQTSIAHNILENTWYSHFFKKTFNSLKEYTSFIEENIYA